MRRLVNLEAGRGTSIALAALPFLLLLAAYAVGSATRLAANPADKLLPAFSTLANTIGHYAFEEDRRSGEHPAVGRHAGESRSASASHSRSARCSGSRAASQSAAFRSCAACSALFVAAISMIPPLAVLPILFIVLGLDEPAKIVLIVIGITPVLVRDLAQRVQELPREQLIKAQTLGASSWQLVLRVILPQVSPRLLDALRLNALFGMVVPDRCRSDRLDRRTRLPHLPGAPLSRHGRDPALRRLDHAARRRHGPAAPSRSPPAVSLEQRRDMSATPVLLKVRRLWMSFGDQVVLENLDFEVAEHEFVTIVGASGCGKTTFLRMLLGVERPTRGQILLDDRPLPDEPGRERGIVFQRYALFPHLSVTEHLLLSQELAAAPWSARLFGASRRAARERAHALLRDVGLYDARDRHPHQLSGGMQQRLSIAQSVICRTAHPAAR